jgi:hypothetical protein
MPELTEQALSCPYCGETISVLIDDSIPEQQYNEDCEVCCRPIRFDILVDIDGSVSVAAAAENE